MNKNTVIETEESPFSCPPRATNQTLWQLHPRVYLTRDAQNEATCPYCGQRYRYIGNNNTGH